MRMCSASGKMDGAMVMVMGLWMMSEQMMMRIVTILCGIASAIALLGTCGYRDRVQGKTIFHAWRTGVEKRGENL
jgi:hypothetical protein